LSRARLNKNGNTFNECDREISVKAMRTISELSKTGIKVLDYIMSYSPTDGGKVYVDKKRIMFECDMGEKSFFNGIKNLVDNNIIAISDVSFEYYFNHAYLGTNKETK